MMAYSTPVVGYYSVAQHSVVGAQLLSPDTKFQLGFLMHDAPEAYLGDAVAPLKVLLGDAYRKLEDRWYAAICERFDLPQLAQHPSIHKADLFMRRWEVRDIASEHWRRKDGRRRPFFALPQLQAWSPERSMDIFLRRWRALRGAFPQQERWSEAH